MNHKKTFSEFIVEQGVLTSTQLVELLIRQTAQMPTVAEIVHSRRLLNPEQCLKAFAVQMSQGAIS